MKGVLIFGAGQVARSLAEILETSGARVRAFVVDRERMENSYPIGVPVVACESVAEQFNPMAYAFVIGIGFRGLNGPRQSKFTMMKSLGYEPYTFVDRNARVARSAKIGSGAFIQAGNEIQTGAIIGDGAMLWSGNHFGHDSRLGSHSWISSHVCVSGGCSIGQRTFIGSGAVIGDRRAIGMDCIIGAGATVLDDVPSNAYVPGPRSEIKLDVAMRMARFL